MKSWESVCSFLNIILAPNRLIRSLTSFRIVYVSRRFRIVYVSRRFRIVYVSRRFISRTLTLR